MRPKICVVVPAFTFKRTLEQVQSTPDADLIEIRFDFHVEVISVEELLKASSVPLIATNRCLAEGGFAKESEEERIRLLIKASEAGYEYVDLELGTPRLPELVENIKKEGSKCILSHHDFEKTPSLSELKVLYKQAKNAGADIAKLVGTANSYNDNVEYLDFLRGSPGNVSFGMGSLGIISRIVSPIVGGAFTYASGEGGRESAPGQLTLNKMRFIYDQMGVY